MTAVVDQPRAAASGSPAVQRRRVVFVTGLSGAGKSTALKALEDAGYEAVDNLPISLLPALVRAGSNVEKSLAIGVDARTRDFATQPVLEALDELRASPDVDARLLFLDADDEVLRRRFTETRRRHPLAHDRPVLDGIQAERALLWALKERADIPFDTSGLTMAELRHQVQERLADDLRPGLVVAVVSFAYRWGLPREADLVFDVRFLTNPHYVPELQPLTGRDNAVGDYIRNDGGFQPFFDGLTAMLGALLPRYEREGKSYLTVACGCTGGKHRSVYVAERLARWLQEQGRRVNLLHRDIERRGDAAR
ncbi:MAG: RNase adapter RapZ [Alphaproteobacteria bacterium]|nr:RNase adapter RapZ [Alphaproteobacteria bacterium]